MAAVTEEITDGWQMVMEEEGLNKYGMMRISEEETHEPIAVIGIGVRVPGAESLSELRELLVSKIQTYGEIPEHVWSKEEWFSEEGKVGYTNNHTAGILPNMWDFDNGFFNVSPREAAFMDPQQFQTMEVTQEALHDAGLTPETLPKNTGVYMSMRMAERPHSWAGNINLMGPYALTGAAHTITANRINFFHDVSGPSMGVDAGCTGSSQCVHFGCTSLWNKECDVVIVGGANVLMTPEAHAQQCDMGYLSTSGTARPLDGAADGRIRAEGCGVVILKPLSKALRDGNHVYAAIRASVNGYHGNQAGLNHFTSDSISEVVQGMYERSSIRTEDVDYVELNASGYMQEDVAEVEAMDTVFKQSGNAPIRVGSLKSNIGHLEGAAGVLQLIKACMMIQQREFFPQANFNHIHPDLDIPGVLVQIEHEKYVKDKNFVVALTSLSFSGQVCHLVAEEVPQKPCITDTGLWKFGREGAGDTHVPDSGERLPGASGILLPVPLSAKTPAALGEVVNQWRNYHSDEDAGDVVGWLATGREHYRHRIGILAESPEQYHAALKNYVNNDVTERVVCGDSPPEGSSSSMPKICFVFPGNGQQTWDMGRSLYATEPVYRDIVDRCDTVWKEKSGFSFVEKHGLFMADPEGYDKSAIDEIMVCQPAIISHQLALATLLQNWGIKPDAVIGHSVGEMSAACTAGLMSLEEVITCNFNRALTQSKLQGLGAMAAARFTPDFADEFVKNYDDVYVACYNSTESVTLAGNCDIINKLASEMPTKLKVIRVKTPFHTPIMDKIEDEFKTLMKGTYTVKQNKDAPLMYSSVTRDVYVGPCDVDYWWRNVRGSVYFSQATEAVLRDYKDHVVFVEVAAAATLLSCIRQTAKTAGIQPRSYVPSGLRGKDDRFAALKALLSFYTLGYRLNWGNITRHQGRHVELPNYPWHRQEYRVECKYFQDRRLGMEDKSFTGVNGRISCQSHPYLDDYLLYGKSVFPPAASVEYLTQLSPGGATLTDITISSIPLHHASHENQLMDFQFLQIDGRATDCYVRLSHHDNVVASASIADQTDLVSSQVDIEGFRAVCSRQINVGGFYGQLAEKGLEYRDRFRVLEEIYTSDISAFAVLRPVSNRHERLKTAIFDAGLQLAMAGFTETTPMFLSRIKKLCMSVARLPDDQNLCVFTELRNQSDSCILVDWCITNTSGLVLVKVSGAQLTFHLPMSEPGALKEIESWQSLDVSVGTAETMEYRQALRKAWNTTIELDQPRYRKYVTPKLSVSSPMLTPDEVRVKVKALVKAGSLVIFSGVVSDVGENVDGFLAGDDVISSKSGCDVTIRDDCKLSVYKLEDIVINVAKNEEITTLESLEWDIIVKPARLSMVESVLYVLMYGTVYHSLVEMAEIQEAGELLMHTDHTEVGQAIGGAVVQICQALSVKVVQLVSSTSQSQTRGVDVERKHGTLICESVEEVMKVTEGRGVPVVLDCSRRSQLDFLAHCVSDCGFLCHVSLGQPEPEVRMPSIANVEVMFITAGCFFSKCKYNRNTIRKVVEMLDCGVISNRHVAANVRHVLLNKACWHDI